MNCLTVNLKFLVLEVLLLLSLPVIYGYTLSKKKNDPSMVYYTYKVEDQVMQYAETGNDSLPLVLFVHGAPGSAANYKRYLNDTLLQKKAHLIAVDRPGYGGSQKGYTVTSIEKQARFIQKVMAKNKSNKPAVLVGHSYGGPIVARIAMDYPNEVGALVMQAPAVDPNNEKKWFVNKPIDKKWVRWALPKPIRVSNDEKLSHPEELEKMLPLWHTLTIPIVHIHGTKDSIVPFENMTFVENKAVNANLKVVRVENASHFIPWEYFNLSKKHILSFLD
jgi:pimeloyl-ACP methyl ester carboxylesterase